MLFVSHLPYAQKYFPALEWDSRKDNSIKKTNASLKDIRF